MTDHELLELAAKAMQASQHPDFANYTVVDHAVCLELGACRGAITRYWSPLTDDGDALRLAVKLSLAVVININGGAIVMSHDASVSFEDACTRRAIVRTAAEIGKEKTE
jgi:hypothetical protein